MRWASLIGNPADAARTNRFNHASPASAGSCSEWNDIRAAIIQRKTEHIASLLESAGSAGRRTISPVRIGIGN